MDGLLPSCIPVNLRASITLQLLNVTGLGDGILFDASDSVESYQCYQITASPTNLY